MEEENSTLTHSIPYRPLPKIIAPAIAQPKPNSLNVGDRLNIQIIPKSVFDKPFWRLYEVMLIDGEVCRLTTVDKKFYMTAKTQDVRKLRNLQLSLEPDDKLRRGL